MLSQKIYDSIRLPKTEVDAIVESFIASFAKTDNLWIFGSRVDLQARGGDIDLYVETSETDAEIITKQRAKFIWDICSKIGDQKIDVVIKLTKDKFHLPIYDVAINNGIKLV
jgi:predicted nucleotidyltransferase